MIDNLPEDLTEAVSMLAAQLTAKDLRWWRSVGKSELYTLHHGCGTELRNDWGLWEKDGPLSVWFRARDIWHPDDFSSIIFNALWCHLNDQPFDIAVEAREHEAYWRAQGVGFDGEKNGEKSP